MDFILPLFAMFLLTFCVGFSAFLARARAVRSGQMRLRDFELLDVHNAPSYVARSTKHLANLFEIPVLFYVVCLVALSLRIEDQVAFLVAWAYVALRVVHTFIHLSYNRVMHRMPVFMLSNLTMAVLWVRVLLLI